MDHSIRLGGLSLRNPLLPGSGPPGASLNRLRQLESAGIGALVTKTISATSPHVPVPRMASDGNLFFNIEKWSERTHQDWISEILPRLHDRDLPLFVSLGYSLRDLETLIPQFDPFCDGFELSTHYISGSPADLEAAAHLAKTLTSKPVFMKLSVHTGDIAENGLACERGGADGLTAINSIGPVLSIDIDKRASRLGEESPYAWLSGPAIKPIAMRAVYDLTRAVRIPVVACGGVSSAKDVIEFILAGAAAVQCCTALILHGPDLVRQILADMEEWGAKENLSDWCRIRGTVVPHYLSTLKSHE
jgi:dihydroorotate dehydrogenase subfamily 1